MRLNSESVKTPGLNCYDYDRSQVTPGIVHLGVGAFHRAHEASYIDDLLAGDPSWGIVGASLRSSSASNALNPQNGLYTLASRDASGTTCRVIGSLLGVIDASSDPELLLQQMANPVIRIVSLTVTEKGYCLDPATGSIDRAHPDIVADLSEPGRPRSVPGILVEALRRRRTNGVPGFTVLSCDNLPENGKTTRGAVVELAHLQDASLGGWIEREVSFPSTMVDRIVPATTPDDARMVATLTGLEDAAPVVTEPFIQWVVEDNFCAGRPAFETVGVTMVDDVAPFENMKLRMLNGSHSTLAYLGYLRGHQTVADAIADPELGAMIHDMMTLEIIPTLNMPEGTDLFAYRDALIERFRNPALKHRTWQIAMDGSQKLPQRLLETIRQRIAEGKSFDRIACGVAGWMRYVTGTDFSGDTIDVRDPMAETLRGIADKHSSDARELVVAYVSIEAIFGKDLVSKEEFVGNVTSAYRSIKGPA